MGIQCPGGKWGDVIEDSQQLHATVIFEGRRDELALLGRMLAGDEPTRVLHIRGAGGIGKTELLKAFARHCKANGVAVARLDGRDLLPTRRALREALTAAVGAAAPKSGPSSSPGRARQVVIVDEIDELAPALHHLPELATRLVPNAVLVLAGRNPLPVSVRAAPEWFGRLRSTRLPALSRDEAGRVLDHRAVPRTLHDVIVGKTGGHPLALVLYADLANQVGEDRASQWSPADLGDDPALVRELLSHLIRTVPDREQRATLEVAAFFPAVSEAAVRSLVNRERSGELFEWLCGLSFVELRPVGVVLHALVREALIADLRWRDPGRCWWVMREVASYHLDRARTQPPQEWLGGLGMVLARSGGMGRILESNYAAAGEIEPAEPGDWPAIRALVLEHEGPQSAELAQGWRDRGVPILVVRDPEGEVLAFALELRLDTMSAREAAHDPGVAPLHRIIEGWELPEGRPVLHFRFWMARDTYQDLSPAQGRLYELFTRRVLEEADISAAVTVHRDPEQLQIGGTSNIWLEGADFELEGNRYGCQLGDMRDRSGLQWMRDTVAAALGPMPVFDLPPVDLTRECFEGAVREALRHLRQPDRLGDSPLAGSRLVIARAGPVAAPGARGAALAEILREQCQALRNAPDAAELADVLARTFVGLPAKQRAVAHDLGMSFNTYRRRLAEAIRLLAERLWVLEHRDPGRSAERS